MGGYRSKGGQEKANRKRKQGNKGLPMSGSPEMTAGLAPAAYWQLRHSS
jgi:hypothetical protein